MQQSRAKRIDELILKLFPAVPRLQSTQTSAAQDSQH